MKSNDKRTNMAASIKEIIMAISKLHIAYLLLYRF